MLANEYWIKRHSPILKQSKFGIDKWMWTSKANKIPVVKCQTNLFKPQSQVMSTAHPLHTGILESDTSESEDLSRDKLRS